MMALANTRNRTLSANTTFHVFNRGADRRRIFIDDADRREFLTCFRRYLTPVSTLDKRGRAYRSMGALIDVLAFCLMPNHFHFVMHQKLAGGTAELFGAALTGYTKYFNARHGRSGSLFDGEYRTVPKYDAFEIQTAIAYVHLNHPEGAEYKFSSHNAYIGAVEAPDWIDIETGLAVFGGKQRYEQFISDYAATR